MAKDWFKMPKYFGELIEDIFFVTDVERKTFLLQSKLLVGCCDSPIKYNDELLVWIEMHA